MKNVVKKIIESAVKSGSKMLKVEEAFAFQPGSHFILMENVAKRMPEGIIKQSLLENLDIAAWGANGPDLGLIHAGELFGNSPWSNNFHYFKIGSFMEEIIKRALASGDKKQIAFAAGWVTHCCGDMGCHGLFVNPEAGVYLDKPEGRPLHMELEKNAEPVLWVDKGGYTKDDYKVTGIAGRFASSDKIPYQLLIDSANAVHGSAPSQNEVQGWIDLFHLALKTGVGYKYTAYDDAKAYLANDGRYDRLMAGFDSATRRCLDLLTGAEKGDYSQFVDRWNLDVGRSDSPISNLKVAIKTASQSLFNFGTGTDDYVYFGIRFKDSTVKEYELDNGKYYGITMNDFEAGNVDLFHLYIDKNSDRFSPANIDSIYLKKVGAPLSIGGDWQPEYIEVYLNGVKAVKETINYYITDENPVWEKKVTITGVEAIPDPADPTL